MDMKVTIRNTIFPTPVFAASGTFGYGSEYEKLVDLRNLGGIFTKAVTEAPRPGNPIPRIVETPSGMLNSIGLANTGLRKFIEEKVPLFRSMPCPIIVNVAGSDPEEYKTIVAKLYPFEEIWGFEINLSCPNVSHGCMAFGTSSAHVEKLTTELRALTDKPLIIKLTPNVTDITLIARAAESGGADAVSCINTLVGMVIDIKNKRPAIPAGTAGLSGPAIRPVGVAAVYKVARSVTIPVIGIGGIMNGSDAIEYLLAGASAVQIGTGFFTDPSVCAHVLNDITAYMEENGFSSIADFHAFID